MTTEGLWITSTFLNGLAEGKGKILYPGGSKYYGEIVAGQAHGEGVFVGSMPLCMKIFIPCRWTVKAHYSGDWEHNRPNGYGKYIRRNYRSD